MNIVLIVEDEKIIRKGIKKMVQNSGVPVDAIIECSNGQAALEVLQNQYVEILFTDIRMPKMDGIELVREIQKLEHKPLIAAISGYDSFSYAVELMRMGVREYILKPVDQNKIKEILEKFNEEINRNKEKDNEFIKIFYQQLKLLMLNNSIGPQEAEVIVKQYNHLFSNSKYVVCCAPKSNTVDYQNKHYFFINDVADSDIFIVSVENKHYLLMNELKDKYVGISSPHFGLKMLKYAYEEAINARKLAFLTSKEKVEYQEGLMGRYSTEEKVDLDDSDGLNSDLMQAIAQRIGADKIKNAIKQIEGLKYDTIRGKYTVDALMMNMNLLLDNIMDLYKNILDTKEDTHINLKDMLSYPSIEEYFAEFSCWIRRIGEEINIQFDGYKNKHKVQIAIEYIQENYDKDLNMAMVSNYISMNYSLFSQVFKQYTGCNFVDYLKTLRINEAKRLLEETDLRVNEISQKVGYNRGKHFMKIFKSICGVSPSEYRKNIQFKSRIQ